MESGRRAAGPPRLARSWPSALICSRQALNGLAYGVLLFLLSVGLTLIFGMLDVVNLAHGSFYMLGAYAGLSLIAATGNFWLALLVAPLAVGARRRRRRAHLSPAALPPRPARPGAPDLRAHLRLRGPGQVDLGRPHPLDPAARSLLRLGARCWGATSRPTGSSSSCSASRWRWRSGSLIERRGWARSSARACSTPRWRRAWASISTACSRGVFAFGAGAGGLSGVIAGPIQSAYPADGRHHPDPRAHRRGGRRPRQPQGLAGGQPHHRPGRDLREGVAAGRLDADDLRGHGAILLFRPQGLFGRALK